MEYYSALKKEILSSTKIWMDPEGQIPYDLIYVGYEKKKNRKLKKKQKQKPHRYRD